VIVLFVTEKYNASIIVVTVVTVSRSTSPRDFPLSFSLSFSFLLSFAARSFLSV